MRYRKNSIFILFIAICLQEQKKDIAARGYYGLLRQYIVEYWQGG